MHLWLERYVLSICAAIAFGLVILNPLKLDWPQRVSLLVAISAFAYFVAHTIHRPKTSSATGTDQRIGFLERQVEEAQTQLKQLANQHAADTKQKERRQTIRAQLAVFLKEGKQIQGGIEYNSPSSLHEKEGWELHVGDYLSKNLDESYAARFRSPSHQVNSYPSGTNRTMLVPWGDITAKMAMLNDFISELRD